MKQIFESWLDQISADVGILACAVQFPDTGFITQSFAFDFSADQWDAIWKQLDETAQTLSHRQLLVTWQCWQFEQHYLQWIVRPDGLALGLLASLEAAQPHTEYIQSLLNEFLTWESQKAA
jgi:hypothetical protein